MNINDILNLAASGLQFVVAGSALRLNRNFGTSRVGWSLFCAFGLLAVLHLIPALPYFQNTTLGGLKVEIVYLLASLLLLMGMIHLETLFKERRRAEQAEFRLRAELESEVKKKTIYLTRAIEELQSEIQNNQRTEAELKAHIDLLEMCRRKGSAETQEHENSPFQLQP